MNAVRNYQKELEKIIDETTGKITCQSDRAGAETVRPPRLFLHSCCAPCSSYVLEYLRAYFRITVFYYNPNISMEEEYRKRAAEQKRLIAAYNAEAAASSCAEDSPGAAASSCVEEDSPGAAASSWVEEDSPGAAASSWVEEDSPEAAGRGCVKEECLETNSCGGMQRPFYPIEIIEGDYEPECFLEIAKGLEQCPEGGERCFACYELRLRRTAELACAGGYDYFATTLTISPLKSAAKLNGIGERLAEEYGVNWLPSDFKKRGGYQRSIVLSKEYNLYRQDYCGCIYSRRQREQVRQ